MTGTVSKGTVIGGDGNTGTVIGDTVIGGTVITGTVVGGTLIVVTVTVGTTGAVIVGIDPVLGMETGDVGLGTFGNSGVEVPGNGVSSGALGVVVSVGLGSSAGFGTPVSGSDPDGPVSTTSTAEVGLEEVVTTTS
jgi:hypothetical protein